VGFKSLVGPEVTVNAQASSVPKTSQRWEYTVIQRLPAFDSNNDEYPYLAQDWSRWAQDNKELPLPVDILKKIAQLGDDGWELVTVSTRSSNATTHTKAGMGPTTEADRGFWGISMAEATTEDVWVFKRPKR
jgi:hypothetical protein